MELKEAETIEATPDPGVLDRLIQAVPAGPAVFLIWPQHGNPYLGRTLSLRRRLLRLLGRRERPSRWLNLRGLTARIDYWRTGSRLESSLTAWQLGRLYFPETYVALLKLRMPPYLKLILTNPYPRTQITHRLSATRAVFYGPFRNRAEAERFESEFLDLFQIRRCREELQPSPDHPGCIYGEMNRCLRPCQQVVSADEYRGEVSRVMEFLRTGGASLLRSAAAARDRSSAELDFEEAARQHQRYERIRGVLRLHDELVRELDHLSGMAVTRSAAPEAVELWFMTGGAWIGGRRFPLGLVEGRPVSLDHRLRETVALLRPVRASPRERQEHLAILARWYYSSWRDGEWLNFPNLDAIPYRKLVKAIHRVATGGSPPGRGRQTGPRIGVVRPPG